MTKPRRQSSRRKRDSEDDESEEDPVVEEEEEEEEEEDLTKPLCVCRRPYKDGEFMVACEGCEEWFHPQCVGTTQAQCEKIAKWYCPQCKKGEAAAKKRTGSSPAGQPPSKAAKRDEGSTPQRPGRSKRDSAPSRGSYEEARRTTTANMASALGDTPRSAEVAAMIDATLHEQFKGVLKQYGPRARTLIFALRDKPNKALREKLLSGEITPESFATQPIDTILARLNTPSSPVPSSRAPASVIPESAPTGTVSGSAVITDPLEGEEPLRKRPKSSDEPAGSRAPQGTPVWSGRIEKTEKNFMPFGVNGFFVSGQTTTHKILPATLEVSGRLEIAKLFQYLHMLNTSGTRKRTVFRLDPRDPSDSAQYSSLYNYFTQRQRAGYVKPPKENPALEELYIVPLSRQDRLPDFLKADATLDMASLYAGDLSSMLLLAVVTRPSAQHAQAQAAAQPVQHAQQPPQAQAPAQAPAQQPQQASSTSPAPAAGGSTSPMAAPALASEASPVPTQVAAPMSVAPLGTAGTDAKSEAAAHDQSPAQAEAASTPAEAAPAHAEAQTTQEHPVAAVAAVAVGAAAVEEQPKEEATAAEQQHQAEQTPASETEQKPEEQTTTEAAKEGATKAEGAESSS
eukprot:m51a1_g461 putative phd-finger family protein (626) ;mRNA; f:168721-171164